MQRIFVMTLIGPDRPGLVEAVASRVADCGGNWLESRMARLAGQFAGILRIAVPEEQAEALRASLRELESSAGLALTVTSPATESGEPAAPALRVFLSVVGHDRPGIVRQISRALAGHGANVEELETACRSAPMSAEALFHASAHLAVPDAAALDAIRRDLERIGADLMVDITLQEG